MRKATWIVGALAALALVAVGVLYARGGFARQTELAGRLIEPPLPGYNFELTSAKGPVKLSDLKGKVVVLFFGYTFCPDVCPTTMQNLKKATEILGPEQAKQVQVVMISVDPERDTPAQMARYASAFHPDFLGLTGTPGEIGVTTSKYGIFAAKAEGSQATDYLVDHTATSTVLDKEGRVVMLWPHQITPEQMASDLEYLIDQ